MIRLVPPPTFKARVPFTVPGAEAPAVIDIEFAHKSPPALAAWWQASKDRPVAAALAEVVKGWTGVVDETGAEIPCDADTLAQFIGNSSTRGEELLRAYVRELTESRLKN